MALVDPQVFQAAMKKMTTNDWMQYLKQAGSAAGYVGSAWQPAAGSVTTSTYAVPTGTTSITIANATTTNTMYTQAIVQAKHQLGVLQKRVRGIPGGATTDWVEDTDEYIHRLYPGAKYHLADGTILDIDDNGNFEIIDKDAKVTYKANNVREFNKYLNASDVLEDFIKYLGSMGVTKKNLKDINIEMFILWLIITAAEKDDIEKPVAEVLKLEDMTKRMHYDRCTCCGRFLSKTKVQAGIKFCSGDHMDRYLEKIAA